MLHRITVADYFAGSDRPVLLDVRTPAEYAQGHVPGAINLPLFSDAERVEVGTLYKQVNPDKAWLRGLELAGAKLRQYVETTRQLVPSKRVAVHCWRGGQRSGSMAWLLERAGYEVWVLEGGYQAFRRYVLDYFPNDPHSYRVLGGPTGSGKTEILHALAELAEPILDLEKLACHKGSSFGALGAGPQPTVEHFENILAATLWQLPTDRPIWVENESKGIGRIFLPNAFYARLQASPLVHIDLPLEARVQKLVQEYGAFAQSDLIEAFQRLRKRLGGQHLHTALTALHAGDLATAVRVALVYYDKTYFYGLDHKHTGPKIKLSPKTGAAAAIARELYRLEWPASGEI